MKKVFDKLKQWLDKLTIPFQALILILLLIFVYYFPGIVVIIKPGEAAVFWSLISGTETDKVYPEGIRVIFPWDEMYIYNVRVQAKEYELDVLTKAGLNVHLDLSIRFKPEYEYLALLHQSVGPNYMDVVIIPEVTSVLRETIGQMDSEQIYTTGRDVITIAINEAIEQVAQDFIQVDDVIIKQIDLPPAVTSSIEYKIEQKHLVEAHEYLVQKEEVEARRRKIEAEATRIYLETIAKAVPEGEILVWRGIQATELLAQSDNTKIVLIGGGHEGLPLILNAESPPSVSPPQNQSDNESLDSKEDAVSEQVLGNTINQDTENMTVPPFQQTDN